MKKIGAICGLILFGCSGPTDSSRPSGETREIELAYAKKFTVFDNKLVVNEPWPGAVNPISYSVTGKKERIVVTSTTHLPYLELLGLEDRLVGFPSTQYISSDAIRKRVENGSITDLGPDGSINLELLISVQPDVVFAFDMGSESATLDKMTESGINVVYNADFLEPTTLGRAEWIKFFGYYFGLEERADSIFNAISARYDSLKNLASTATGRPTVLSGIMYGDVWFMPGGQNYGAKFFEDAGADYLFASDTTTGWLEISFESVYETASEADYWIGVGSFGALNELKNEDQRYASFQPFKTERVFNYSKRRSPFGGFDIFESGYARPDVVLADLIFIFHPELLPGYENYYYERLK